MMRLSSKDRNKKIEITDVAIKKIQHIEYRDLSEADNDRRKAVSLYNECTENLRGEKPTEKDFLLSAFEYIAHSAEAGIVYE